MNKNDRAASRQATLNVVVEGESVATITFNQSGAEPVLKVDVKESGRTVSVKGETFNVGVEANLGWVAELVDPADAAWVTVGDYTDDMQTFVCTANESDTPREAKVTIKAYGTSLSQTFSIHQADRSSAFELAEKVTVAELLALGEGKIARNVYVEGTVISDRTTRNYPLAYLDEYTANTMFVEDATGGLWIEFDDAVDNTYDLNDDVAIHMYGQSIARDTYTNGLKIDGLTSSAVQSAVPGKGVEPIVVEDISQLSQYENRLVTLRDVEFVLPYGTLCNINEAVAAYGIEQPAKYQRSADYNDLTLEYGHYLRDGKGRLAKLYTSWSFTERGLHLIPEGTGDITGIVNKRYKADRYRPYSAVRQKEESWCIRVRRESDITNFSASDATRHSKTVMQIGPWSLNKTALPEIVASVGKGRLKHSVGVTVKGSTTGTTDEMYWAWAHVRNGAATFDAGNDRWLPAYGNATTVQYTAVMAQNWWKNTAVRRASSEPATTTGSSRCSRWSGWLPIWPPWLTSRRRCSSLCTCSSTRIITPSSRTSPRCRALRAARRRSSMRWPVSPTSISSPAIPITTPRWRSASGSWNTTMRPSARRGGGASIFPTVRSASTVRLRATVSTMSRAMT